MLTPSQARQELHLRSGHVVQFLEDYDAHRASDAPIHLVIDDVSGLSRHFVERLIRDNLHNTSLTAQAHQQLIKPPRPHNQRPTVNPPALQTLTAILLVAVSLFLLASKLFAF